MNEFVQQADGSLDGTAVRITDLYVFRREPAPHAVVLQISVQPFGEIMIYTRIANEAGVKLNRVVKKE